MPDPSASRISKVKVGLDFFFAWQCWILNPPSSNFPWFWLVWWLVWFPGGHDWCHRLELLKLLRIIISKTQNYNPWLDKRLISILEALEQEKVTVTPGNGSRIECLLKELVYMWDRKRYQNRPYVQERLWEKFEDSSGPMHLMRRNWDCKDGCSNWQKKWCQYKFSVAEAWSFLKNSSFLIV